MSERLVLNKPHRVEIEHDSDTGDIEIKIQPERKRWRKPAEVFVFKVPGRGIPRCVR